jgi:hypothetical protein
MITRWTLTRIGLASWAPSPSWPHPRSRPSNPRILAEQAEGTYQGGAEHMPWSSPSRAR